MILSCMTWFTGFEVMLSSPSSRHNLVLSHSVFGPCVSLLLSRSTEKKNWCIGSPTKFVQHGPVWSLNDATNKSLLIKHANQDHSHMRIPYAASSFWTQCCVWLSMHCTRLPCLVNPLCHLRISAAFPTRRIIDSKLKGTHVKLWFHALIVRSVQTLRVQTFCQSK